MKLVDMYTKDYLRFVASDAPAPGGGSASALCGSQGIGLIGMVAKLTTGKEKFAQYKSVCDMVISQSDELCGKLCAQIDTDTEAYKKIADAYKLPKGTDEEKKIRKETITYATLYAAEVPLETMRLGLQGLECAVKLMGNYNPNCVSDVGCGVYGLISCIKGAWLNVLINTDGLLEEQGTALEAEGRELMKQAEILAELLETQINNRFHS